MTRLRARLDRIEIRHGQQLRPDAVEENERIEQQRIVVKARREVAAILLRHWARRGPDAGCQHVHTWPAFVITEQVAAVPAAIEAEPQLEEAPHRVEQVVSPDAASSAAANRWRIDWAAAEQHLRDAGWEGRPLQSMLAELRKLDGERGQ